MLCPYCQHTETRVTDKRDSEKAIRRRRECLECGKRFSTREAVELGDLRVIKKSGNREPFSRDKLKSGILRACEKRPVSEEKIYKMIDMVEERARKKGNEVTSSFIGQTISNELKKIDKVAYIRFASVYRDFTDLSDFKNEIRRIVQK